MELSLDEFCRVGLEWKHDVKISSMCTVFAESEVVSLVADDTAVADIVHGLDMSVAGKTASLSQARARPRPPYLMTGGVGAERGVVRALEDVLALRSPRTRTLSSAAPSARPCSVWSRWASFPKGSEPLLGKTAAKPCPKKCQRPEGGNAINARLCRERAEYLRGELSRFPALQDARRTGEIKTTHKVATWTDVANLLEADSLKEEAASVRAVLSTTKDMGRQEAAIRKLPCWSIIEQQILPQLRIVDIEYQYYTNRVKTREEIWELYQTDPGYRAGQKQVPYEFYELLGMIKDPKEKETIARAAYTSVKDEGRPAPMAIGSLPNWPGVTPNAAWQTPICSNLTSTCN